MRIKIVQTKEMDRKELYFGSLLSFSVMMK